MAMKNPLFSMICFKVKAKPLPRKRMTKALTHRCNWLIHIARKDAPFSSMISHDDLPTKHGAFPVRCVNLLKGHSH